MAGHLLRLLHDPHLGVEQVDVNPAETEALPGAEPAEPGEQDEGAEPRLDHVGQLEDERRRHHRPFRGPLLPAAPDPARVRPDQVVGPRRGEDGPIWSPPPSGDDDADQLVGFDLAPKRFSVGTATAGTDYTALGLTTVDFAAGETTKTVTIDITGDTAKEANETFNLALTTPVGATIADTAGTATIINDDT